MPESVPAFPPGQPRRFTVTVHGTVFGDRQRFVDGLTEGQLLRVVPDPPVQPDPQVWIHLETGEPLGHLPDEVGAWLAPWLQRGGRAVAAAVRVHGVDAPSWRRLVVRVDCTAD